jgi:membrane associated rhomboid family serine protease
MRFGVIRTSLFGKIVTLQQLTYDLYKKRKDMNSLPNITKHLLIINVLVFLAQMAAERNGVDMTNLLGLHFVLADDFRWYQLFTYMFLHQNFGHLFFNMFAVWMFGRIMEVTLTPKRFLFYYLTCGVGAGITQELVQYISYLYQGLGSYEQIMLGGEVLSMGNFLNRWTTIGASGAVYGILLAFGMTFPNERMFIFPLPVPIKAKFFVLGYAVLELMSALGSSNDGVAHFAHLGGMLFGLLLLLYWRNGGGVNRGGGYYDKTYNRDGNSGFRKWFSDLKSRFQKPKFKVHQGGKYGQEMDYNKREKEKSEELDRILDKVKAKGYDGLTEEEKKKLFDFSRKK